MRVGLNEETTMAMFGLELKRPRASEQQSSLNIKSKTQDKDASVQLMPFHNHTEVSPETELSSLMSAVNEQAINLKCEQLKVISDWQINMDLLSDRVATLQPLLEKSLKANGEREQTIARLTSSEVDLSRRLSEAERDLAHYRPLALRLEEELRIAQTQLSDNQRKVSELEAECDKSRKTSSDLFQKTNAADIARQRAVEQNTAYAQKLLENDTALQSSLRESARLKSELVSISGDVERLENELENVSGKLTGECDEHARARVVVQSLQAQIAELEKDSQARIKGAEERERRAIELASLREKQCYDLNIRESALQSKLDFLNRMNLRLRGDMRRQLDHIGNLEASNNKLLDALARATGEAEIELLETEAAQAQTARLHVVKETP
jgi:chromosome segregation ATPase